MTTYSVIALMSGTSLDGLDLLHCHISAGTSFSFEFITADTYAFSPAWIEKLSQAHTRPKEQLKQINEDYTSLLSEYVQRFMTENNLHGIDFIASHGHTVLHQPDQGLTYQIGNLPKLARLTGLRVICDFRVQDVELGGQGAPLVPIGDRLFFGAYDACVNLGGFANISFETPKGRLAYDICPVNKVLNLYASKLGKAYDENGSIARASVTNPELISRLEKLQYYDRSAPKSLGIEWLEAEFLPLLDLAELKSEEVISTCTQHFARQIAKSIEGFQKVLFTGGGAFNTYLMELIASESNATPIIPEAEIINYKEALIFGLLGVLKARGEVNVLASVTGASQDHSSGFIYEP